MCWGVGPGGHLRSLENHFSGCLTKTFGKISQSWYHPYLEEQETDMWTPLDHTGRQCREKNISASLIGPRARPPPLQKSEELCSSTVGHPLCNNLLQLVTTEPWFFNNYFQKTNGCSDGVIVNATVNKEGTFLLLTGCFIQIWPSSENVTIYYWFWHWHGLYFCGFLNFPSKHL